MSADAGTLVLAAERPTLRGALHTAGLIWILQDKTIVAISDDAVIVETANGIRQSYRPRLDTSDASRRVLLWELDGSE